MATPEALQTFPGHRTPTDEVFIIGGHRPRLCENKKRFFKVG